MRLTNNYSPWKHAAQYPWLHIETRVELPGDTAGLIGPGTIWICRTLQQAQRRCVLAHELVHLERGHACNNDKEEATVDRIAAHRLINDTDLRRALQWTSGRIDSECAEELWVDLHTLIIRAQSTPWIPKDCIPKLDHNVNRYVGV